MRAIRSHGRRASLLGALAVLLLPAAALAHAVVYPQQSAPGAYEKYVLRVPNERGVPTTTVELRVPAELRVVSFGDVPGWTLEVQTDSARRIVGAIWRGALPPQRFVELPFIAVNPPGPATVRWPAVQTYADGERVEWSGPAGSERPASETTVGASLGEAPRAGAALWIAVAAGVLALIGLGVGLRRGAA